MLSLFVYRIVCCAYVCVSADIHGETQQNTNEIGGRGIWERERELASEMGEWDGRVKKPPRKTENMALHYIIILC